jgi:hypothetical protein
VSTALWIALAVVLVASYITWTAGRLDRLHARVDASWAALDAALVRRAAAARALLAHVPEGPLQAQLEGAASSALEAEGPGREAVENDLSRTLRAVLPSLTHDEPTAQARAELELAVARVGLARSFHNGAVRDTLTVRRRLLPRALRLAGHRAAPTYFDVDDTALG